MIVFQKSYWLYGNLYTAVECTTQNGVNNFYGIKAEKKGGEFEKLEQIEGASVKNFAQKLPKGQHLYVIINTDKVLLRELPLNDDQTQIMSDAFPSLSLDEFYSQIFTTKTRCFVAVCRKEYVESILEQFEIEKLDVLGFNLGFFNISDVLPFIANNEVITSRYSLEIENNSITTFSENKTAQIKSYAIEQNQIDSNHLVALSGLSSYAKGPVELSSGGSEKNKELKKLQQQKVFFKKGSIVAISVLLISLLINALLFNGYYSQLKTEEVQSKLGESQKESYMRRLAETNRKQKVVENIVFSGKSKSSFYINRIVSTLPKSIGLAQLDYQPLLKTIRPDKAIEFSNNEIIVTGNSLNKEDFTLWIKTLESLVWIQDITISEYSEKTPPTSSFAISLKIKNNESAN